MMYPLIRTSVQYRLRYHMDRVRFKYCTWLLDCVWSSQFQRWIALNLTDVTIALPSHDKTWSAPSATGWFQLMHKSKIDRVHLQPRTHCTSRKQCQQAPASSLVHELYVDNAKLRAITVRECPTADLTVDKLQVTTIFRVVLYGPDLWLCSTMASFRL